MDVDLNEAFRAAAAAPELTDDIARFVGKANCVAGIDDLLRELHGDPPHRHLASASATAITVDRRRAFDETARKLLRVAWQTELAASLGTAFDEPALQRVAAQTLPVNAYYALFNAHRALARAQGSPLDKHQAVHDAFAKNRAKKLPLPWSVTLTGYAEEAIACELSPEDFLAPYAFNPMERSHEPAAYLFAALRMTRRWKYDAARAVWLDARVNRKTTVLRARRR